MSPAHDRKQVGFEAFFRCTGNVELDCLYSASLGSKERCVDKSDRSC